jgi:hypothetical protein
VKDRLDMTKRRFELRYTLPKPKPDRPMKLRNILTGYKTYVTAIAAIAATLAAVATGEMTNVDAVRSVFTAVLAIFLRSGMKASV